MAWDYKNPGIPTKGDQRYEIKFPNTYQVLDCVREHHYDLFKEDLTFQGQNFQEYFGCCETAVYSYKHMAKRFAGVSDSKWAFKLLLERGTLGEKNNYLNFMINERILGLEVKKEVLEFIKRCMKDITTRDCSMVLTQEDRISFLHVPYDRTVRFKYDYWIGDKRYYTTNELVRFLTLLYDNSVYYMNMIDESTFEGLNENELEWISYFQKRFNRMYDEDVSKENRYLEFGPKLEYVRYQNEKQS